jgi:hypothetical protein
VMNALIIGNPKHAGVDAVWWLWCTNYTNWYDTSDYLRAITPIVIGWLLSFTQTSCLLMHVLFIISTVTQDWEVLWPVELFHREIMTQQKLLGLGMWLVLQYLFNITST